LKQPTSRPYEVAQLVIVVRSGVIANQRLLRELRFASPKDDEFYQASTTGEAETKTELSR